MLLGYFLEIGQVERSSQDPGAQADIDAWFLRNSALLEQIMPSIQAVVRAIEATLKKELPAWQRVEERNRERCAALGFFLEFAARAGLTEIVARIDTTSLDACLKRRAASPER